MRADRVNAVTLDHDDAVGVAYRREAVRDDERGASDPQFFQTRNKRIRANKGTHTFIIVKLFACPLSHAQFFPVSRTTSRSAVIAVKTFSLTTMIVACI